MPGQIAIDLARAASAAACGAGRVVGAGCDLVFVPEFKGRIRDAFLRRVFHDDEVAECRDRFDLAASLAARWAAKEAAYKAFRQVSGEWPADGLAVLRDYVVRTDPESRIPRLRLGGAPAALLERLRAAGSRPDVALSLTHDGEYAAAFVVVSVVSGERA
ncbi:MAG: 4'-phosphopantetheinyl transferase superfamily protein [Myxococcales bacterium]